MHRNLSILALCSLVLVSCGDSYTTSFAPPKPEQTYREILPKQIAGSEPKGATLELDETKYKGLKAAYGAGASITLVQCKDEAALDEYFKTQLVPTLENGYTKRMSGKFNGIWSLRGSGAKGRIRAWQNHNWIFVIEADDEATFDEIVANFDYIAKK